MDFLEFRDFIFSLLQLLLVAIVVGTSSPLLSETCLFLLLPLLVTIMAGTSTAVGEEPGLQSKVGSGCSSSDDG